MHTGTLLMRMKLSMMPEFYRNAIKYVFTIGFHLYYNIIGLVICQVFSPFGC